LWASTRGNLWVTEGGGRRAQRGSVDGALKKKGRGAIGVWWEWGLIPELLSKLYTKEKKVVE